MKRRPDFHFKQFSVSHDRSTHKIGTDGVLLGAWVSVSNCKYILDIGTGTSVIALMLAQRTNAQASIDAVELEKEDAEQARENVLRSPWPDAINVIHAPIQQFSPPHKYDLIVSNPPYFMNSWRPPEKKRSQARHTHELSFEELLECSIRLLKKDGRLAVILPHNEGMKFIAMAKTFSLFPARQLQFRSRADKPVERLMTEFTQHSAPMLTEELVLHSTGNDWSEEYKTLTRDFYLNL